MVALDDLFVEDLMVLDEVIAAEAPTVSYKIGGRSDAIVVLVSGQKYLVDWVVHVFRIELPRRRTIVADLEARPTYREGFTCS